MVPIERACLLTITPILYLIFSLPLFAGGCACDRSWQRRLLWHCGRPRADCFRGQAGPCLGRRQRTLLCVGWLCLYVDRAFHCFLCKTLNSVFACKTRFFFFFFFFFFDFFSCSLVWLLRDVCWTRRNNSKQLCMKIALWICRCWRLFRWISWTRRVPRPASTRFPKRLQLRATTQRQQRRKLVLKCTKQWFTLLSKRRASVRVSIFVFSARFLSFVFVLTTQKKKKIRRNFTPSSSKHSIKEHLYGLCNLLIFAPQNVHFIGSKALRYVALVHRHCVLRRSGQFHKSSPCYHCSIVNAI